MCRAPAPFAVSARSHAIQTGFTYLTVLFILAMLGGGLALTGEVWHTAAQREKETDLLFVGREYRRAIERYYLWQQRRQYPRNLDDLLKDPRDAATLRHLRKRYEDPFTGKPEWGIVKAPDGGIMGVHSLSEQAPLKKANFRATDKGFDGSEKYSDWKFVYTPPAPKTPTKPVPKPGTGGTAPTTTAPGKP